ncbi:MAG: hypothetical protein ACTSPY_07000 [Candidatus Helarchaeota archaeon]
MNEEIDNENDNDLYGYEKNAKEGLLFWIDITDLRAINIGGKLYQTKKEIKDALTILEKMNDLSPIYAWSDDFIIITIADSGDRNHYYPIPRNPTNELPIEIDIRFRSNDFWL